jgi:hypothetical protein
MKGGAGLGTVFLKGRGTFQTVFFRPIACGGVLFSRSAAFGSRYKYLFPSCFWLDPKAIKNQGPIKGDFCSSKTAVAFYRFMLFSLVCAFWVHFLSLSGRLYSSYYLAPSRYPRTQFRSARRYHW